MALQFGFYDSLDGDRKYNALQWSSIFDGIIRDGVFQAYGQAFNPVASGTNLSVTISSGRAWFNHTWFYSDGDANDPITLVWDSAHQLLPEPATTRIDAIVFRVDQRTASRENSILVVKGPSNGSRPVYGDGDNNLKRGEYVNDYVLAFVTVHPNASAFTQSVIQSNIGSRVSGYPCPFVTGPLEILDDDVFWEQWDTGFHEWMEGSADSFEAWMTGQQSSFSTWFLNLQNELDEHQAANLQNQIDKSNAVRYMVLDVDDWELGDDGMYAQTLTTDETGVAFTYTDTDTPILVKGFAGGTETESAAYGVAYGVVANGEASVDSDGATFKVYRIPDIDVRVGLKGV